MSGKSKAIVAGSLAAATLVTGVAGALAAQHSGAAGSQMSVTLEEMSIVGGPLSVKAGPVTFIARNVGSVEHELVVVRDTKPLVVKKFKANEGGRWIGEIEGVLPGKSGKVTLKLKPGDYLLLCNIVGHYQLGMKRVLTVT